MIVKSVYLEHWSQSLPVLPVAIPYVHTHHGTVWFPMGNNDLIYTDFDDDGSINMLPVLAIIYGYFFASLYVATRK